MESAMKSLRRAFATMVTRDLIVEEWLSVLLSTSVPAMACVKTGFVCAMKDGVEKLATREPIVQTIAMDTEYVRSRTKQRDVYAMHPSLVPVVVPSLNPPLVHSPVLVTGNVMMLAMVHVHAPGDSAVLDAPAS